MQPELLVSRVFGVEPSLVGDDTSSATLAEWDSLAHVTLVMEVESVYGVALSVEEVLEMTDVAAIKRVLESRGVRW